MATKTYQQATPDTVKKRTLRIIKGTATFEDRFVPDHEELVRLIAELRASGCVIVFVTGVWDLFHLGHAKYLREGKKEASKLYPTAEHAIMVVGVDSDELTKMRKGDNRPIVPQEERLEVLGELRSVDVLTVQTEPDQLFLLVDHDVRITSSSTKDLPDRERIQSQCEHIVNLPPQAETSTSARVRRLAFDGAITVLKKVEEVLATTLDEVRRGLER